MSRPHSNGLHALSIALLEATSSLGGGTPFAFGNHTMVLRRILLAFGIFTAAVILFVQLVLPTLIKNEVNKKINETPGFHGHVEAVHLHVIRGGLTLSKVQIYKDDQLKDIPFFSARDFTGFIYWLPLFKKQIIADVKVIDPIVNMVLQPNKPAKPTETPTADWRSAVKSFMPFDIASFEVRDGQFHFRDLTKKPNFDFYIDRIKIDAENLTNTKKLSGSLFARVQLSGKILDSGDFSLSLAANPLKTPLEFKLDTKLLNLNLPRLNPMLTALKDIQIHQGQFDLVSEVAAANNKVKGYIKPLFHNLKVSNFKEDKKKGLGHAIKEKAIGAAAQVLKNFPHDEQATKIPFEGNITQPKPELWPTVVNTYRNIFIQAIQPKYDGKVSLGSLKSHHG